jgi:hypothetical protein
VGILEHSVGSYEKLASSSGSPPHEHIKQDIINFKRYSQKKAVELQANILRKPVVYTIPGVLQNIWRL